jgi:transposase
MAKDSRGGEVETQTVGIDLGDRYSEVCVLDSRGEVIEESRVPTTRQAFERWFAGKARGRVVIEVGTHSPWVERVLTGLGHEVLVANARQVRLIYNSHNKGDRVDAERLARLARVDPRLLSPITHRSLQFHADRAVLRSRDVLVSCRTSLINHARGLVKAMGFRFSKCSTSNFHTQAIGQLPEELKPALEPVIETIAMLTRKIRHYDRCIEELADGRYPVTEHLRQISGVGALTALGYVLTIEDPTRFRSSRALGAYLGLSPRRSQSGERDPELRISKRGDSVMRRLLVGSAQYILGPFGPDTDLRRWGLELAQRGRKNAKKRAVVAVARKLAVLLHRLWVTAEVYEPLRSYARSSNRQAVAT